jgi:hypothetical protein
LNKKPTNEITHDSNNFRIESLGSIYFSIQGITQEKIVEILQFENIQKMSPEGASSYLYAKDDFSMKKADFSKIKAFVSSELNGWVYLMWELGWFEECKFLVEKLMKHTDGVVAYFYVDPYVDGYEWIIAQGKTVIREFKFDMGELYSNVGSPVSEEEIDFISNRKKEKEKNFDEWIESRENPFISCEKVYASIIKNTSQDIEELNNRLDSLDDFYTGTINLNKLRGTTKK